MRDALMQYGALARRHKALVRLAHASSVLAPTRDGPGYGVYPRGDRRRRPMALLHRDDVQALAAAGAIRPSGIADCYLLSGDGREIAEREAAPPTDFPTAAGGGQGAALARLMRLSADGACRFSGVETVAARRIWEEIGQGAQGPSQAALEALPAPMAAAVIAFYGGDTGIEALERRHRWPARSGRLVLKLALGMLAEFYKLA